MKEDVCTSEVLLKVINNELPQQLSLTYNMEVFGIFAIVDPLFMYGWTIVAYINEELPKTWSIIVAMYKEGWQ